MAYLNDNYLKLQAGYLFPEIARRVREFCDANPDAARRLIRCGIGDVTEPLPPAIIAAMHQAVDELSVRETFRGYGHEQGLESLREKIAQQDYRDRGSRSRPMKFSSPTDQNRTAVSSSIFSATKTESRSPIRFTLFNLPGPEFVFESADAGGRYRDGAVDL